MNRISIFRTPFIHQVISSTSLRLRRYFLIQYCILNLLYIVSNIYICIYVTYYIFFPIIAAICNFLSFIVLVFFFSFSDDYLILSIVSVSTFESHMPTFHLNSFYLNSFHFISPYSLGGEEHLQGTRRIFSSPC